VFGRYFKALLSSPSLFIFCIVSVPYIFLGYVAEILLEKAWLPLTSSIISSWDEFQLNDTGKSMFVFIVAYFFIVNPLLIFMYSHSKILQKSNNYYYKKLKSLVPLMILVLGPFICYGIFNWALYVPISVVVYKIGHKMQDSE